MSFKLSPSALNLMDECERCLWLDKHNVWKRPKGKFLEKTDEWKEKLLIEIKEMFESKGLTKFIETKKYKVVGVPFFNQLDENKFKEELLNSIN